MTSRISRFLHVIRQSDWGPRAESQLELSQLVCEKSLQAFQAKPFDVGIQKRERHVCHVYLHSAQHVFIQRYRRSRHKLWWWSLPQWPTLLTGLRQETNLISTSQSRKIRCYKRNDCSCKCCECQATSLHMYQIGWAKTQQFDSVLRTQIQCFWIRSIDGFAVVWLSLACSADLPWVPSAKSYRLLCQFAESDLILSQGGEVAVDAISFHTYQADTR